MNLDETIIQGDLLVDAFKTISRDSILDCPLKFLSLEKYENRININHLKLIGACLPKLQYLNIGKFDLIKHLLKISWIMISHNSKIWRL